MPFNIKLGEEGRKGGHSELWHLSSQVTVSCDGTLLSWRWLNTYLPMGSRERIPCFALLMCMAFVLPIKLSLSQPTSFPTFTLPFLPPIPPEGSEQAAV